MFSSEAYGQKNLLFKDATSELVPIATQTYEAWLGREYLHAMKGLLCDPNRKSTFLFSCWPQPDYGCGQACWRGGHRRTHTQEVCVLLGLSGNLFLPPPCLSWLGKKHLWSQMAALYPGNPTCSGGWDPEPQGLS